MAVDLPKIQRSVFHLILTREETPSPEQTATGKDVVQNPFTVVGLPKIQIGVQTPHNVDSSRFSSSDQRLVREETTKTVKIEDR